MHDILDLKHFPLDRPGTPAWQDLVDRCRADLETSGMFNLDAFLHPAVAAAEVASLLPRFDTDAFRHEREHNIYFLNSIDGLPADHPALQRFKTSNQTLCADQVRGRPSPGFTTGPISQLSLPPPCRCPRSTRWTTLWRAST